jgi:hypothetical protein
VSNPIWVWSHATGGSCAQSDGFWKQEEALLERMMLMIYLRGGQCPRVTELMSIMCWNRGINFTRPGTRFDGVEFARHYEAENNEVDGLLDNGWVRVCHERQLVCGA